MFQVERLKVVSETLDQICEEVKQGKVEDVNEIKRLAASCILTINDIEHEINEQEAENEDS